MVQVFPSTTPILTGLCQILLGTAFLLLTQNSCTKRTSLEVHNSPSRITGDSLTSVELRTGSDIPIWSSRFEKPNWMGSWGILDRGNWGWENLQVIAAPRRKFSPILRVSYPANSASPTVTSKEGNPIGGVQFYANLEISPQNSLGLIYYVRFSDNFDFVRGGKLPGLFGGTVTSGGKIPDGTNGFSTRYMWRRSGDGEVYAYLPTSHKHGTSIGRGNWRFQPGKWYQLKQEVVLNQPGKSNGRILVWLNGRQVLEQGGLIFRTTNTLKVEGIFFSTFFGGADSSWATTKDVYADFANFSIYIVH